jgi:PAS domain S-box-containing protein
LASRRPSRVLSCHGQAAKEGTTTHELREAIILPDVPGDGSPRVASGTGQLTLEERLARLQRDLDAARIEAGLCRTILESATDYAILTIDPQARVTSWNTGAANLLGWSAVEALGLDSRVIFTPEDRARGAVEAEIAQAVAEGRAEDERWHVRQDGSRFWGSGLLVPLHGGQGFLKIMRDRTAQHRTELALQASEDRFRSMVERISDAFLTLDLDWRVTYANRRVEQDTGRRLLDLLGRDVRQVFPALRGSEIERACLEALAGQEPVQREVYSPLDGRWLLLSAYPADEGLSVFWLDVTGRKEAEERQALLLRELNHRVKNTLAVVLAMARRTRQGTPSVAEFLAAFEGRLRALATAHELLSESGWQATSLVVLARAALAPHDGPGGGQIRIEIGHDLPLKPAAAQDLVLVLHELATNAAKHGALSVPGGTVVLEGQVADGELRLVWRETGGPAATSLSAPGFSTTLLQQAVVHQYGGRAAFDWQPDGLVCMLRLPVVKVAGPV